MLRRFFLEPRDDASDVTSLLTEENTVKFPEDLITKDACHSTDPFNWFPLSTVTVDYWLQHGPDSCRNENVANYYPASVRSYNQTAKYRKGRKRCFNSRLFYSIAPNGENQSRKWLMYSPSKGSVYCFHCTLMMSKNACCVRWTCIRARLCGLRFAN